MYEMCSSLCKMKEGQEMRSPFSCPFGRKLEFLRGGQTIAARARH